MYSWMCSSTPGLYPLDACSTPSKLSLDIDKYLMGTKLPQMKINALVYLHLYGILFSKRAILFLNLRISLCNAPFSNS